MDESTLARFMAKVNKTETCWLWTGSLNDNGYGHFWNDGLCRSSRLSYQHHHGEIPEGLVVRHKCRNKHCVNPDHLEVGTHNENMQDKLRDGTYSRKLTEAQVLSIIARTSEGSKKLAEEFGVSQGLVSNIIHKRRWTNI